MTASNSDRTPQLDPATVAALRNSFAGAIQNGSHGDELQHLLRQAATESREKGITAEQLLLSLKSMWQSLPGRGNGNDVEPVLLRELVSRCIRQYYAD